MKSQKEDVEYESMSYSVRKSESVFFSSMSRTSQAKNTIKDDSPFEAPKDKTKKAMKRLERKKTLL